MSTRAVSSKRRVLVVTGSRAEFGLLRPVMAAIRKNRKLELRVCVAGEHLLGPAMTWRDVAREFRIDAKVPMQRKSDRGRGDHAAACGRGMTGFAEAYKRMKPDWVVVLGDRIEAFAAASAASIAGIAVCHIHGGDRAEGIADEAMRHAITKLAHLHCAATKKSAERILKMGEPKDRVFVTGSPAIDGLANMPRLTDREAGKWRDVSTVVLLHPCGSTNKHDERMAETLVAAVDEAAPGDVLALAPNHDPGREVLWTVIRRRTLAPNDRVKHAWRGDGSSELRLLPRASARARENIGTRRWHLCEHLPRGRFIGLLKRIAARHYGLIVGNSSAGLIEAPALGVYTLNVGPRQAGRERPDWIETVEVADVRKMIDAIDRLMRIAEAQRVPTIAKPRPAHPFGEGRAGTRIAALLARIDTRAEGFVRKRIEY